MMWIGLIMVMLSVIASGAIACRPEEPSLLTTTGTVVSLEERELYYQDNQGFGSGKIIPVPITFLELKEGEQVKKYLLAGPYILKEGDNVQLTYLVDNEVTGWEIWNRYYPERANCRLIDAPAVRFKVDGYVMDWETK